MLHGLWFMAQGSWLMGFDGSWLMDNGSLLMAHGPGPSFVFSYSFIPHPKMIQTRKPSRIEIQYAWGRLPLRSIEPFGYPKLI